MHFPITLSLEDNGGETTVRNFEELAGWVKMERDFHAWLEPLASEHEIPRELLARASSTFDAVDSQLQVMRTAPALGSASDVAQSKAEQAIGSAYRKTQLVHSTSQRGRYVKALSERDPLSASYTLAYFVGLLSAIQEYRFSKGIVDALLFETKIHAALDGIKEAAREDLRRLKDFYTSEMDLREATRYWADKQEEHRKAETKWGAFTFLMLIAAAVGLARFASGIPEGTAIHVGHMLEALILTTFSFWFIRLLSRNYLSQAHLRANAAEREALIKTYLALLRENGAVGSEDRRIILPFLFEPTKLGLIKDDAAPPHFTDFFRKPGE